MKRFIGIPFIAGGRTFAGVDCWGLVRLFYSSMLGIEVPDFHGYEDGISDPTAIEPFADMERAKWEAIPSGQEGAGDVVLLRIAGCPCHVGIVLDKGTMIHAELGIGSMLERYDRLRWKNRVLGFYRWPQTSPLGH